MASTILAISEVNRKTLITSSYYPIGSAPTGVSYVDGSYTGDINRFVGDGDSKYFTNIRTSSINGSGDGLTVNFQLSNSGGQLIIGSPSVVGDGDSRGTNYFVDETVLIDGSEFNGESGTDDITFIVTSTDFSDGNVSPEGTPDIYIYYDRYDRVLYHVSKIGGIEVIYTVSGDIYTPTTLPGKAVVSGIRLENSENILVTFSENLSQLVQDFPNDYISITNISVDGEKDDKGLITFLSGSLVGSNSIRLKFNILPFDVKIGFDVTVLDGLENLTSAVVSNLILPNPNGINYGPSSYIEWTGPSYFLDENYNVTYYDKRELIDNFGITSGGNISRLGFPLHLTTGEGGNVTDDMIANQQFVLAAAVVELPYETEWGKVINDVNEISPESIRGILYNDKNGEFNTKLLDIERSAYNGTVELYPEGTENRYIFFPVEPITYNGGDVLVIYWMNGIDGPKLGWNGGYTTGLNIDKMEEVLAINANNDYLGYPGVNQEDGTPEKAAITFTIANSDITNQTRVFTHSDNGDEVDTISDYLKITRAGATGPGKLNDDGKGYGGSIYNPLYEYEYGDNKVPMGNQIRQAGIDRYISMKSKRSSRERGLTYQPYIGPNYPGIAIDDDNSVDIQDYTNAIYTFGVENIIEWINRNEDYYTDGAQNGNPRPQPMSDAIYQYLNIETLLQSPAFTLWNADGWADLTNVTSRTYNSLVNLSGGNMANYVVDRDLIMYDVVDNAYYKVSFRSWTKGGGGGFQYFITSITVPYETVPFTHTDEGNEIDTFNANLRITRGNQGAIYNPVYESSYAAYGQSAGLTPSAQLNEDGITIRNDINNGSYDLPKIAGSSYLSPDNEGGRTREITPEETFGSSPAFTLWNAEGWDDLSNVTSREFTTFTNCLYGQVGNYILDRYLVMYDILDNKYYRIQFTEWSQGGGSSRFQYYKTLIK
jgi:hypothetical protein